MQGMGSIIFGNGRNAIRSQGSLHERGTCHAPHQHMQCVWNGIWSDMFIEITLMRYDHSHGAIIGITLRPETLKTWALGLHTRSKLVEDIACMSHPQEGQKSRIAADAADRATIRETLDRSIDPLSTSNEPDKLVNIVSGRVAPDVVNLDKTRPLGPNKWKITRAFA
jgi:hypothetical protein